MVEQKSTILIVDDQLSAREVLRGLLTGQGYNLAFAESGADALFLDLPNPEAYLAQVRAALKPGGFFGTLLPTTNQVTLLLKTLGDHDFAFVEVCETMLRYYNPIPDRLRPQNRMVAHTGYLVFARPIVIAPQNSVE